MKESVNIEEILAIQDDISKNFARLRAKLNELEKFTTEEFVRVRQILPRISSQLDLLRKTTGSNRAGLLNERGEEIKSIIERHFNALDLTRPTKQQPYPAMKRIFCFLMKQEGFSDTEIGRFLGVDRTTVIYHEKKFRDAFDYDFKYRGIYQEILERYNSEA